jgi:hypothetical protein
MPSVSLFDPSKLHTGGDALVFPAGGLANSFCGPAMTGEAMAVMPEWFRPTAGAAVAARNANARIERKHIITFFGRGWENSTPFWAELKLDPRV